MGGGLDLVRQAGVTAQFMSGALWKQPEGPSKKNKTSRWTDRHKRRQTAKGRRIEKATKTETQTETQTVRACAGGLRRRRPAAAPGAAPPPWAATPPRCAIAASCACSQAPGTAVTRRQQPQPQQTSRGASQRCIRTAFVHGSHEYAVIIFLECTLWVCRMCSVCV
eukprot:COSAG05_NODE_2277_length_3294_cov_2.266354_3_plen_166_part_00